MSGLMAKIEQIHKKNLRMYKQQLHHSLAASDWQSSKSSIVKAVAKTQEIEANKFYSDKD